MEEVAFKEILSDRMRVEVKEWEGECKVDIRCFFIRGKRKRAYPTKRGVSMTLEEWEALKNVISEIDGAIDEVEEMIVDTEEAREEEKEESG